MADGERGYQLQPQPESRYCSPGAEVHRDGDDGPVMKPRSGQVRSGRTGPGQTKPWQRFNWGPHGAASLIPHRSSAASRWVLVFSRSRTGQAGKQSARWLDGWDGIEMTACPGCRGPSASNDGRPKLPVDISLHHREIDDASLSTRD